MNVTTTVEKVTGFVIRQVVGGSQLLVFRHPTMGLQVPAGTVELGESPAEAVVREIREETGLTNPNLIKELGRVRRTLPKDEGIITRMTKLFDTPAFDASSEGYGLTRGSPVRVLAIHGKFALVESDVLEFRQQPTRRKAGVSGYVRRSLIGRKITRYFYHLTSDEATADTWAVQVDGHIFELFWVPINPIPDLTPVQAGWLANYYSDLLVAG